jgi:site-specific recombinase XerD
MKTDNFTSCLADEMAHFVKFKQSCGSDYHSSAKLLFRFDQHLVALLFKSKALTRSIFQNYFETINHLCPRGFTNHYSVLQQFSVWLNLHETDAYVLEKRRALDRSHSRPPYIFTVDEIKAILGNSANFSKKEQLIPGVYQTLFSLLYSTGIRIGDLTSLMTGMQRSASTINEVFITLGLKPFMCTHYFSTLNLPPICLRQPK